jgi:hypothetical protein
MPRKQVSLQFDLPIPRTAKICDLVCQQFVRQLNWKLLEKSDTKFVITKDPYSVLVLFPVKIEADIVSLSAASTIVKLDGQIGWIGPVMSSTLQNELSRFSNLLKQLEVYEAKELKIEVEELQIQEQIAEGLVCPKCRSKLAPGTDYCPIDGTRITRECPNPQCQHSNKPNAIYCVKCGTTMQIS